MLDQIQAQVQTLSQLSQEMMELAQIESGQVLLKLVETELRPVVEASVAPLLPQAAVKNQSLTLHVPEGLVALIDEQQIGRVISNLVHNAVKFTPEGGTIDVRAEASGEDVTICVQDSGLGIPREEQARVFERFYKADRARSRGGTGLGLAIARHIVEGHGGRIWVVSIPGQGATFCFTAPRA
jgi:two-component system, OmpR family, phosphate regulon sensor histidine kinase PhoR